MDNEIILFKVISYISSFFLNGSQRSRGIDKASKISIPFEFSDWLRSPTDGIDVKEEKCRRTDSMDSASSRRTRMENQDLGIGSMK
jgi:hypothetical protein